MKPIRYRVFGVCMAYLGALITLRAVQTAKTVSAFSADPPPTPGDTSPVAEALEDHRVSILVPAWEEGENMNRLLQDLAALPFPNIEVLVRAGGDDDTLRDAETMARLHRDRFIVFEQPSGEGKQRALAAMAKIARGDILYLVDADSRLSPTIFAETIRPVLLEGEVGSTTLGKPFDSQMDDPGSLAQWAHFIGPWARQGRYTEVFAGHNGAVLASVASSTEAFGRFAPIGTDYALSRALVENGHRIVLVKSVFSETDYPRGLLTFMKRTSRHARAFEMHVAGGPQPKLIAANLAWWSAILGALIAAPEFALLVFAMVIAYGYASRPGAFILRRLVPQRTTIRAMTALTLACQAAPWLTLRDAISSSRRHQW